MTVLEIEVKFFLEDAGAMEKQVKALGAEFQKAVDETNIRFETRDNALLSKNSLLRLRRADQTTLTYKAEKGQAQTDYKIHTEYEVSVDNFEMMHSILKSLGFHAAQVYEKHRTSYQAGEATLCIDVMPYGVFLEIEGPKAAIRSLADRLGLAWEERILMNYLEMFDRIRSAKGFSFTDVTFENFRLISAKELSGLIKGFRMNQAGLP